MKKILKKRKKISKEEFMNISEEFPLIQKVGQRKRISINTQNPKLGAYLEVISIKTEDECDPIINIEVRLCDII